MEDFNLITPTLLFSAVSLIMLAYTNRFLSYAQLVRNLRDKLRDDPGSRVATQAQLRNLRLRLQLTRGMQLLGVGSLLVCTITMLLIFIGFRHAAVWAFGSALLLFIGSLGLSVWEIMLSTRALDIYLKHAEERASDRYAGPDRSASVEPDK